MISPRDCTIQNILGSHRRRRRRIRKHAVVFVWCMALRGIHAFSPSQFLSIGRNVPSRCRRRSVHVLSSTLPVVERTDMDREIYNLYTSVAISDPEWFQEYIVNLVGTQDTIVNDAFFRHVKTINALPTDPQHSRELHPSLLHLEVPPTSKGMSDKNENERNVLPVNDTDTSHLIKQIVLEGENGVTESFTLGEVLEDAEPANSSLPSVPVDSIAPMPPSESVSAMTSRSEQSFDVADIPVEMSIPLPSTVADIDVGTRIMLQQLEEELMSLDDRSNIAEETNNPLESSPEKDMSGAVEVLSEPRVVVYWHNEEWKQVNLTTLLQLGYTEPEIVALQSTALDCIVRDLLPKPRTGVPSRWKALKSEMVQVVESSVAPVAPDPIAKSPLPVPLEDMAQPSESRVASHSRQVTPSDDLLPVDPIITQSQSKGRVNERKVSRDGSQVEADAKKKEQRPEAAERRARSSDTPKERPVYSGRPSAAKRIVTRPPPPKSSVWPDIETFRKLLRDEASFRLRILGSDWSEVVKDEMDWRNDLYTSWLWTLHHGIGEPLVQSRSDRARRRDGR